MTNIIEKLCIEENGPEWDSMNLDLQNAQRRHWAYALASIESAGFKLVTKQQYEAWTKRDYHEAMAAAFQAGKK